MTDQVTGANERHEDRGAVGSPVERPVRPLDYKAAIAHCHKTLGHAQGTKGCIAFARGAEWAREPLILEIERLRGLIAELLDTELAELACAGSHAPVEDILGRLRDALKA